MGPNAIRTIALAAAFLAIAISSARGVQADHQAYLVDDPGYSYGGRLPGIERPWIVDGQPFYVCSDWTAQPMAVSNAIADWEAVLPGAQFIDSCAGTPRYIIRIRSVSGNPWCPGAVGCAMIPPEGVNLPPDIDPYTWDEQRGAYYMTDPMVYINDDRFQPLDGPGLQYAVAHEMGHTMGLHDAYLGHQTPDFGDDSCNGAISSIMDYPTFSGSTVMEGCDGHRPTAMDITNVVELYDNSALTTVPLVDAKGADIIATIIDQNVAESNIAVLVEWFNGIGYSFYDSRALRHDVGRWGQLLTFTYRLPSNAPEGFWAICAWAYSELYTGPDTCSSAVYVIPNEPLRDTDGDGYSDRDEAGWPMCYGAENDDAPDDGDVNDGCPAYGGLKEAGLQCYNVIDDDAGDDSMINDGCPTYGSYSEWSLRIGTDHRSRCHPGAETGPSSGWPSDFVSGGVPNSTDKITVQDLTSFLAPVRRLNTNPGYANFNSRWDLVPGRGVFANFITANDITALIAGTSGYPPMFGGQRAIGLTCTGS